MTPDGKMTAGSQPPARKVLSRRAAAWIVAALTLGAFALRMIGLGHQLPHKPEADAVIVWQAAWFDRPPDVSPTDEAYLANFYPYLLAYVLAAMPGHSYRQVLPAEEPLEQHLAAASEPYLRGRILIACLSILLIPATYLLARRFLARGPACLAAAFIATGQLDTFFSQQARPHAAAASFCAIGVVLALRHLRVGTLASLAWASLAACLALGALHNGIFVFPALALAWWLAPRRRLAALALPIAALVVALVVFYPFLFEYGLKARDKPDKLDIGGQTLTWSQITFDGFRQIVGGMWSFDPMLTGLAGLGLIALIVDLFVRKRPWPWRALLVAAAFPLTFIAFWSVMLIVWERFMITIQPFAAVLAAGLVAALFARVAPRAKQVTAIAAAALLLAVPLYACVRLVVVRARPDTQTLAARWVERNADVARDRVAVPPLLSFPLLSTRASIEALPTWARSPWEQYQQALPDLPGVPRWELVPLFSKGDLADKRIERAEVLRALDRMPCTVALMQAESPDPRFEIADREVIRELGGEPVETWLPYPGRHDRNAIWFLQVLQVRAWGPPLEAYRLRPR